MIEKIGNYYWFDDVKTDINETFRFTSAPVYEVIRIMDGVPLFFDAHLNRLKHSLEMKSLTYDISEENILRPIIKWIADHELSDFNMRIEVGLNSQYKECVAIMAVKPQYPSLETYLKGIDVSLEEVVRKNPHAKVLYSDYQEKMATIRKVKHVFEVILHDDTGKISEGSRSNLFWIKEGKVFTAKSEEVLLGITRENLMAVLEELNIECVECDTYKKDIRTYEAAFLTGTSIHLMPIATIDTWALDSAKHPLLIQMMDAFSKRVEASIHNMKERTQLWFQ